MTIFNPPSFQITGQVYFAAPNGSASGAGTIEDPLDITTALGATSPAGAGDAIYLLAGTYSPVTVGATSLTYLDGTAVAGKGVVTCALNGSTGSKILVRNMPGQAVRINAGLHAINGQASYVRFQGIEFAPTPTTRTYTTLEAGNEVGVIYVTGTGVDFVNCYIHDYTGSLFYYPTAGGENEIHGNVIGRMGVWQTGTTTGRGYSLYTHNAAGGTINVKKNAWIGGFNGYNIGPESGSSSAIKDFYIQYNQLYKGGVLIGSSTGVDDNNHVDYNYVYNPPHVPFSVGMESLGFRFVGYNNLQGDGENLTALYNYIVSGGAAYSGGDAMWFYYPRQFSVQNNTIITRASTGVINYLILYGPISSSITSLTVDNNDYWNGGTDNGDPFRRISTRYDFPGWKTITGFDANSTFHDRVVPSTNVINVVGNDYENGRGFIAVYNWENLTSVTATLTTLNITDGARCRLRNCLNMSEYVDFTYSAASPTLAISMLAADWSRTEPTAWDVPGGRVWPAEPYPAYGLWQVETLFVPGDELSLSRDYRMTGKTRSLAMTGKTR